MTNFYIATIPERSNSGSTCTSKSRHCDVMKSDWEMRERESRRDREDGGAVAYLG